MQQMRPDWEMPLMKRIKTSHRRNEAMLMVREELGLGKGMQTS